MKQQTAVEWLEERFDKYMAWRTGDHKATEYTYQDLVNDFDKARQMEKEQLIGLLEWMNKVSQEDPMRLETDLDDIVDMYLNETYENPNT